MTRLNVNKPATDKKELTPGTEKLAQPRRPSVEGPYGHDRHDEIPPAQAAPVPTEIQRLTMELSAVVADVNGGSIEKARGLLNRGAKVEGVPYLLFLAIENRRVEMARWLLENGADVHARNADNDTALHEAASNADLEMCRLLFEYGADVNARGGERMTPLMTLAFNYDPAARLDAIEVLKLFIAQGANINDTDNGGMAALDYADTQQWHAGVAELERLNAEPGPGGSYGEFFFGGK